MRKREYLTLTIWLALFIWSAIHGNVDLFIWVGIIGTLAFSVVATTGHEHDTYLPPQHARPKGQRRGDSSPDEDGLHWGVMFGDGSVHHPWNGRTQRQRAHQHLEQIMDLLDQPGVRPQGSERITLCVRRHGSTTWTRYVPSTDA